MGVFKSIATKSFSGGVFKSFKTVDGKMELFKSNSYKTPSSDCSVGSNDEVEQVRGNLASLSESVFVNTDIEQIKQMVSSLNTCQRLKSLVTGDNVTFNSLVLDDISCLSSADKLILADISRKMFDKKKSNGEADLYGLSDNVLYLIPFGVLGGVIPPQLSDGGYEGFLNPQGCVSVSRLVDSLSASKNGYANTSLRRNSLDGVSNTDDFYNVGYNMCLHGLGSPFYRLYTRAEMFNSITYVELAYIICVCHGSLGNVMGFNENSGYRTGVNLDWDNPQRVLASVAKDYPELTSYKVSTISVGDRALTVSVGDGELVGKDFRYVTEVDLNPYKSGRSMTEFISDMKSGKSAIPLPMIMSLLELQHGGILKWGEFTPLKEVSRIELLEIITLLQPYFNPTHKNIF